MLKGENFFTARRRELLIAAFTVSVTATIIFGVRAYHQMPRKNPAHPIHSWMTLKYVARTHRVQPQILYEALALPDTPRDKRSIRQIAESLNLPEEEVIIALEKAIERAQTVSSPAPAAVSPVPNRSEQLTDSR